MIIKMNTMKYTLLMQVPDDIKDILAVQNLELFGFYLQHDAKFYDRFALQNKSMFITLLLAFDHSMYDQMIALLETLCESDYLPGILMDEGKHITFSFRYIKRNIIATFEKVTHIPVRIKWTYDGVVHRDDDHNGKPLGAIIYQNGRKVYYKNGSVIHRGQTVQKVIDIISI